MVIRKRHFIMLFFGKYYIDDGKIPSQELCDWYSDCKPLVLSQDVLLIEFIIHNSFSIHSTLHGIRAGLLGILGSL